MRFKKFDIIELASYGSAIIIVDLKPNRPVNQYIGILVNGKGAQYKFGEKHTLEKIGEADENHPAIVAWKQRQQRNGGGVVVDETYRKLVDQLVHLVLADNLAAAQTTARVLQGLNAEV